MIEPITADSIARDYTAALCNFRDASPKLRDVLQSFSEQTGISIRDLKSPKRRRDIAHPRQALMLRMFRETRANKCAIGRILGGRDHSTVDHGIKAAMKRAEL